MGEADILKMKATELLEVLKVEDRFENGSWDRFEHWSVECVKTIQDLYDPKYEHLLGERAKFLAPTTLKDFITLLRNIAFRRYRDGQLLKDGKIGGKVNQERDRETTVVLREATTETASVIETAFLTEKDSTTPEKWAHFTSPVSVFNQQVLEVAGQLELIARATEGLDAVRGNILTLKEDLGASLQLYNDINQKVEHTLNEAVALIQKGLSGKGKSEVNSVISSLQSGYNRLEELHTIVRPDSDFSDVGVRSFPVDIAEGELIVKELDVEKNFAAWFDANINASLIDIHQLTVETLDKALLSLFDTINRLRATLINEVVPEEVEALKTPVTSFLAELHGFKAELEGDARNISRAMDVDLYASAIFSDRDLFLPLPNSITGLSGYGRNGKSLIDRIPFEDGFDFFEKGKERIADLVSNKYELSAALAFIQKHEIEESHSLFLKRGYLGNSFHIERKGWKEKISDLLQGWMDGYHGSVLIYGNRLSGRSSMLESLALPSVPIVSIHPNQQISFEGRKFEASFDLGEAISFIYKNSIGRKACVVIDDLELWRDSSHHFYENATKLIEAMNKYSRQIFFFVSTNKWMKHKLDDYFNFSTMFGLNYSTDQMSSNDIVEAVLTRHRASVGLRGRGAEEENMLILKSRIEEIVDSHENNVGACMRGWYHANEFDEIDHPSRRERRSFEQLIGRHWTFLFHLLKYRSSSEVEFRDSVGEEDMKDIASSIQFLLSCKILQREYNGQLTVNESIVDKVERALIATPKGKMNVHE